MKRLAFVTILLFGLLGAWSASAQQFDYKPSGQLESGTAGRPTNKLWVSEMRFPIEESPAYANSQVWGHGGAEGPGGSQCDAANYSYPWYDNYCEPRKWDMPLCPGGTGHQGQDIRPKTCEDAKHWAVATEAGTIIDDSGVAIKLKTASGRTHRFLHLAPSTIAVQQGDQVQPGDRIGKISTYTGGQYPTTIHLHYDMRQYVASDPQSGASVGEVAYLPTYMSLIDSYKRLIGEGGLDGQYEAKLEARLLNGEDRYTAGSSEGVPDFFPGETIRAAVYLKNAGEEAWPTETWLGYWFQTPYLTPLAYRIESDHPEYDQSTWEQNSADTADENPEDGNLTESGALLMHAFSPEETKRIVLELEAGPYSIGAADHPDVRSWMREVDGVYGIQDGFFEKPSDINSFDSRIRDFAQIDILSRDHWHFEGGEEAAVEGWTAGSETVELKCNKRHDLLAQAVDGSDARIVSPEWTSIDADQWDQLVLRLRAHNGPHQTAVFWAREGEEFSEDRKIQFEAQGDSEMHAYVLPVGDHPEWSGTIDRLRIDQLQGEAPGEDDSKWHDLGDLFFQSSSSEETNSRREEYVTDAPVDLTNDPDGESTNSLDNDASPDLEEAESGGGTNEEGDESSGSGDQTSSTRQSSTGCALSAPGESGLPPVRFALVVLLGLLWFRPAPRIEMK